MKQSVDVRELALLGYCDRVGRGGSNSDKEKEIVQRFWEKLEK